MGKKQKEVWQEFSNEIQATYVKGRVPNSDRIEADFQNWHMVYDIYIVPVGNLWLAYTRLRAPFTAKTDFKFRISRKTFLSKIAEKFGKSNVQTGDALIDDAFVIESNDAEKIKHLLSDKNIKILLLKKADSDFQFSHRHKSIGRVFPKGCDGLNLAVLGDCDAEMLMLMYNLFGEILTSLMESGEIDYAPAEVKI